MRKVFKLAVIGLCMAGAGVFAYDAENPALNKVTFREKPDHGALKLVENGKPNFSIVFDHAKESGSEFRSARTQSIRKAAEVIADAVEKCTGAKVMTFDVTELDKAKQNAPYLILLGDSEPARAQGVQTSGLPREGFVLKTFPEGIVIAGRDGLDKKPYALQRGTLWGAYDFLERFLGCRWYFPGEYGNVMPKVADLTVTPVQYTDSPRFKNRTWEWWLWMTSNDKTLDLTGKISDIREFTDTQRLERTTKFWAGHDPNPQMFAKAYPDKFDLMFFRSPQGTLYQNSLQHPGNFWNVPNLALADFYIESLKKLYSGGGNDGWSGTNQDYISIGQCDMSVPVGEMLENPSVKAERLLTPAHLAKASPMSDIYARFWQYFAKRAKEAFPDKKVIFLPYADCVYPPLEPERWTLGDNAELRLCVYDIPGRTHNKELMAKWKNCIEAWKKVLGGRPVASLWLYSTPLNPFASAIAPQMVGDACTIFGDALGDDSLFFDQDCGSRKDGNGLLFYYYAVYVSSRAMWNPKFDGQAAIDEHWDLFYGPESGKFLKEFHRVLLKMHLEVFTGNLDEYCPLYPAADLDKLESLLASAEKVLPRGGVEEKRFRIFAYPWKNAIALQRTRYSYVKPMNEAYFPAPGETIVLDGKADEAFWKRCRPVTFMESSGRALSFHPDVRLAWTPEGLFGFVKSGCPPPSGAPKDLWENPHVELFIAPDAALEKYYQYAADTRGHVHTGSREVKPVEKPYGKTTGSGFKAVTAESANEWTMEFFLPWSDLNTKAPMTYSGKPFHIVVNKDARTAASSSLTLGNNHNFSMFGILKFLGLGD